MFICNVMTILFLFCFQFEMIYLQDSWLDSSTQYRWFIVTYQIGVFTSRTLGSFLTPRKTWWAAIVQIVNACFFFYEASSSRSTNTILIFGFVFWLGCVGGLCYVQSFLRLVKELPANHHKFSLGMITIAESCGIAIGGLSAVHIHDFLCRNI